MHIVLGPIYTKAIYLIALFLPQLSILNMPIKCINATIIVSVYSCYNAIFVVIDVQKIDRWQAKKETKLKYSSAENMQEWKEKSQYARWILIHETLDNQQMTIREKKAVERSSWLVAKEINHEVYRGQIYLQFQKKIELKIIIIKNALQKLGEKEDEKLVIMVIDVLCMNQSCSCSTHFQFRWMCFFRRFIVIQFSMPIAKWIIWSKPTLSQAPKVEKVIQYFTR